MVRPVHQLAFLVLSVATVLPEGALADEGCFISQVSFGNPAIAQESIKPVNGQAKGAQAAPPAGFHWNLRKEQKFDVGLKVQYRTRNKFWNLSVSGRLTITAVTRPFLAEGKWKIGKLSHHQLFVDEEKMTYSSGRWTKVSFLPRAFFDAADRARKQRENTLRFRKSGKEWAQAGGEVDVTIGAHGFSVGTGCPVPIEQAFEGAVWPSLSHDLTSKETRKVPMPKDRTWFLMSGERVGEDSIMGRWTKTGASPAYQESGSVDTQWTGASGQSVKDTCKYTRTTSASTKTGCVSSVREKFTVSRTVDGNPQPPAYGSFSLTLKEK